MKGKIIRGIGGFYYIHTGSAVYECKAKGIFRKDNIKPLPGDLVEIAVLDEEKKLGNNVNQLLILSRQGRINTVNLTATQEELKRIYELLSAELGRR